MESILQNIVYIILGVFVIISIVLTVIVIMMNNKLKRFLIGIDSEHIGDSLTDISSQLKNIDGFRKDLETYLTGVEKRLRKSVQSVQTVRFNPFKGTGGGSNQSFSTAFLNQEGDGVIISSLYSREHVSIFSKPIKSNSSEYELSEEEKESLESAKKNI
jgi:hypothetical protein